MKITNFTTSAKLQNIEHHHLQSCYSEESLLDVWRTESNSSNSTAHDTRRYSQQEAFEKCWAHSPLRAAARRLFYIAIHQVPLLSHAACASMSTTTTTTTTTTTKTTRDRGDRYGPIEWVQLHCPTRPTTRPSSWDLSGGVNWPLYVAQVWRWLGNESETCLAYVCYKMNTGKQRRECKRFSFRRQNVVVTKFHVTKQRLEVITATCSSIKQ